MADVTKIKLPDNSEYNLKDHRISGVDTTPTSGSNNVITSGGVYSKINEVIGTYGNAKIFYGTCSSSGDATAKVVTCSAFTSSDLVKGALIFVTFDKTNSGAVDSISLNVNNTGAKHITKLYNATANPNLTSAGELKANKTYLFGYDGTYWVCLTLDYNNSYSSMTDAEIAAGTGTTGRSITPARLKTAIETWSVQANWNELNDEHPSYIQNKPTIPSKVSDLTNDLGFTSNTGTLTGVSFNGVNASITNGVASITADLDSTYIVHITTGGDPITDGNTYNASTDHYYSDIANAYSNGKVLIADFNGILLPHIYIDESNTNVQFGTTVSQLSILVTIGNNQATYMANRGLTSETDPIFSASPAADITSSDITNWNAKGNAKIFYGTCNSQPNYINKIVVCPDFTSADLVKGALIFVTFDYTNNADVEDVKLNVNSTGGLYIREPHAESSSISYLRFNSILQANCTYLFTYDGTYWVLLNGDSNIDTKYSIISQSEAQTGTLNTGRLVSPASLKRDIEYRMAQNQADWNVTDTTSPSYIQNKPSIPSLTGYATEQYVNEEIQSSQVTESTVSNWGFTKNAGTLTGVSFNGVNASVSNGIASISASIPLVIDVGKNPTTAPTGTFTQCQNAILANRVVALMVRDDEDDNRYLYVHQDTGTYYGSHFMSITFYRVSENYIYYYILSPSENLTYARKQIGTLTGVKFNNTNATINGTVAEITATIPAAVTESTVSGWGFTKNTGTYSKPSGGIPATDLESAVQTSLGKADTALQSFTETDPTVPIWAKQSTKPTYTASEVGALPDTTVIPTVPTNVSAFTNDANYVKYVLCTDEAAYNAISNKDSGTLYLIPK